MAVRADKRLLLRRMRFEDLDEVMRIELAAHKSPWSRDLMRRELDHEWSTILLAVESERLAGDTEGTERVLGYCIFWLVHDEIHILNVATDPAHRRKGAARLLLVEAERLGRPRGAVLSTLEVRKSNDPAITLYKSLGYRPVGVRPRYYSDENEDAIVMTKDLLA